MSKPATIFFELYERASSRLVARASSFVTILNEARWRGGKFRRNGTSRRFYLVRTNISNNTKNDERCWPSRKLNEFRDDWIGGMPQADLKQKYGCSAATIRVMSLRLKQRFDAADDPVMIYMLNEGMTIDEIAEHFQRAPDSLLRRLGQIIPPQTKPRLYRAERQFREEQKARRKTQRTSAGALSAKMGIAGQPLKGGQRGGGANHSLSSRAMGKTIGGSN